MCEILQEDHASEQEHEERTASHWQWWALSMCISSAHLVRGFLRWDRSWKRDLRGQSVHHLVRQRRGVNQHFTHVCGTRPSEA